MFELIQVGEKSYYLDSPVKIGIYRENAADVYLIDSGGDKDCGRRVRKILDENGWNLRGIVNTHSNADHIGGNQYLQKQTGCRVFANGAEAAFTRYPLLEPSFLYGGYPCRDLRHKFLLAAESDAEDFSSEAFPRELEVLPLPGHFFDMAGIRTPDGTVFLADCLSSKAALEKYRVTFIYDVRAYLETLARVAAMEAPMFVPAHAAAAKDIRELAEFNRGKVLEVAETLVSFCASPATFERLLKRLFDEYGLTMNFEQYVLVGSTVRSYLAWLKDEGRLGVSFEGNELLWHRA